MIGTKAHPIKVAEWYDGLTISKLANETVYAIIVGKPTDPTVTVEKTLYKFFPGGRVEDKGKYEPPKPARSMCS